MPDAILIHLSSSGIVRDLPILADHTKPWDSWDLGEFLALFYPYLDEYADRLSVPRVSAFIDCPTIVDPEREPRWHDAAEGLRTFEALVTELVGRLGTNDSFEHMENVLWGVRMFELILRKARDAGESFYLDV
jgi:hypothetical protein